MPTPDRLRVVEKVAGQRLPARPGERPERRVQAVCADVLVEGGLPAPGTDLVLVADAFYERDLAGKVMGFLERSHAHGTAILAGDFGRAYLPRGRLTPLAAYDVPDLRTLEGTDTKRTTIWTLPGPRG